MKKQEFVKDMTERAFEQFHIGFSKHCVTKVYKKCGAENVGLFASRGSAPQGILRGGIGSRNRRRPLISRWAEQSHASKQSECSGPLAG